MMQTLVQTSDAGWGILRQDNDVTFKVFKAEHNLFIERVPERFGYSPHGKADKGALLRQN